jgi:hypothetical protein
MNTESAVTSAEGAVTETSAPKRRKSPGIVRQRVIDQLSLAERLAEVAQKAEHAPKLAAYGLDAAFLASFVLNLKDCRAGITHLASDKGERREATTQESTGRTALLNELQAAQSLAKLRLTLHPAETGLKARYHIGGELRTLSRASLESAAQEIIGHLKSDNFKGFEAPRIAALEAHFTAWRSADSTQSGAQSSAITTRQQLLDRFAEVEKQRRALQIAADTAYPYTNKANAGVRGEFGLPKNGPIKTV